MACQSQTRKEEGDRHWARGNDIHNARDST